MENLQAKEEKLTSLIAYPSSILNVTGEIRSVLVFNLNHDDWAAVAIQEFLHFCHQNSIPDFNFTEVVWGRQESALKVQ